MSICNSNFRLFQVLFQILNPVNIAPGDLNTTISIADLKGLTDNKTDWNGTPDLKYFLAFDLYPLNTFKFSKNIDASYPLFGSENLYRFKINYYYFNKPLFFKVSNSNV